MRTIKILLWDSKLSPYIDTLRGLLSQDATVIDAFQSADVTRDVAESEVIITSTLSPDLARQAGRLRLLHAAGVGTDGIPFDAFGPSVQVATTGHHERSIAEHIVMSLIALQRDVRHQDAQLRTGRWSSAAYDQSIPQPPTLEGRVATFLGFGGIGQATWRALRHFGVQGISITRSGSTDAAREGLLWAGVTADLGRALQESDVLVISIPLTAETEGIVSGDELSQLGTGGLLVNVAREPVVEEAALFHALSSRSIAGAAVDVWYRYPGLDGNGFPSDLPFGSLDNIIMTPHSSGVTQDTFRRRVATIAENVNRFAAGESLIDEVTQ